MRKIETQMNDAIANDKNWSGGNTTVATENGVSFVYLHGNKIAEVDEDSVTVFDGGWRTNTTKSRLNAIINRFCDPFTDGVHQSQYEWFIRDNEQVQSFVNGYTFS